MKARLTSSTVLNTSKLIKVGVLKACIDKSGETNLLGIKEIKTIKASISDVPKNIYVDIKPISDIKTTIHSSVSNKLKGTFYEKKSIIGSFSLPQSSRDIDIYAGPYEVIPKIRNQTLDTKNRMLSKNIFIKQIPYYETSNESGYTVYIGGE